MSTTTKRSLYPLHLIIGFGILILFWLLPPIDPITPLGMPVRGRIFVHGLSVECG